jgi:hypothetical protein
MIIANSPGADLGEQPRRQVQDDVMASGGLDAAEWRGQSNLYPHDRSRCAASLQ